MGWFQNNKITQSLQIRVNALNNQLSSVRSQFAQTLLGISHDGKRNLNDIYGYPDSLNGSIGFQLMYDMAKREGIANRLTYGTARTCWREGFEVFDSTEEDANELLADEIAKLNKAGLTKKIERADILNRIGAMSVLFVGVPDGREPSEPVGKVTGDGFKSIYFQPFAYDGIEITKIVNDPKDPRYGLPELYQVSRQSRGDTEKDTSGTSAIVVHWSRIIHMSEGALDSNVEGTPFLQPIYNRIIDINKATGGSAEAYFRNARGKIAFEVDKDFAASTLDPSSMKKLDESAMQFTNEWKDHIYTAGAKATAIDTPHHSPRDTVMASLWEVAGYSGYPIRILTGEGSGQLAGSEDQLALNAIIADRQNTVCADWVVRVFEILSMAGMIEWNGSWVVRFPKQSTVTEMQQVELDNKKADTLLKLSQAKSQVGGDEIDFRSALDEMGLKDVETDSIGLGDDIIE